MRRSTPIGIGAFLPGLAVVAVGVFVAVIAAGYPLGSAFRPGPGFFPLAIGGLLVGLGLVVIAERLLRGAQRVQPDDDGGGDVDNSSRAWRALAATTLGMLAFALLLERLGFVPATVALVVLAAFGEPRRNWLVVAGIAGFMSLFGTIVFIWGLGMPLDPFGGG